MDFFVAMKVKMLTETLTKKYSIYIKNYTHFNILKSNLKKI